MSWESIVLGVLQGFSNFAYSLINIITGSLNPAATEGIIALIGIGIVIRLIDGVPKIPGKIIDKVKKRREEDDEDAYEYIRVRRQRR